jgi:hypothetical protein
MAISLQSIQEVAHILYGGSIHAPSIGIVYNRKILTVSFVEMKCKQVFRKAGLTLMTSLAYILLSGNPLPT